MRRECRERFPRHRHQNKPFVSDPDMHHGVRHARAVMHAGIANSQCRGKRSRHSRRMHNPQLYVSSKRPESLSLAFRERPFTQRTWNVDIFYCNKFASRDQRSVSCTGNQDIVFCSARVFNLWVQSRQESLPFPSDVYRCVEFWNWKGMFTQ